MGKFLKNFGLGLVYIVLLPLLLAVLVIFGLYGLVVCIVEFFSSTIRFFQGKEPFPPLWEDVRVAEIKKAQMDAQLNVQPAPTPAAQNPAGPSTVYVQQNYYQNHQGTAAPTPQPQQPIDTTGYFQNQAPSTPILDASNQPSPALSNEVHPGQIPQNSQPEPSGYIDISHSDDTKGEKS
jgi:hypothetical protein